jgi:hypothetical protein
LLVDPARRQAGAVALALSGGWCAGVGDGRGAAAGMPNPVTGKPSPGRGYATATVVHCESVLRGFYEFHLQAGSGPMVNPFPLARGRRARANAHHDPMDPFPGQRRGRCRPPDTAADP